MPFESQDRKRGSRSTRLPRSFAVLCAMVVLLLIAGRRSFAQSQESANAGHSFIWVGGGVSGYYLQYGAQKSLGITGYLDADSVRRLGMESEARWLNFHLAHDINAQTFLAGPRYHFNMNRFQPYIKGLGGIGNFNFSYNYAHGRYIVIAPGGGFDYRVSPRLCVRADFEYQYWPQFTYGAMSSPGASVGFRYLLVR